MLRNLKNKIFHVVFETLWEFFAFFTVGHRNMRVGKLWCSLVKRVDGGYSSYRLQRSLLVGFNGKQWRYRTYTKIAGDSLHS